MINPKVSIIITAHNYGQYLEECLKSAINQNYKSFEIIVVDDGSIDDTPIIIEKFLSKYPEKIRTVRLEGLGLPAAINRGMSIAKGEYVILLDADDYFDENILIVEANYLDSNPNVDLVYPDYYTVDIKGNIMNQIRKLKVDDELKLLNRSPLAAGAMCRKKAWEEIGGYDESLKYQEDYDFWIKFINKFTVQNINLPLMYYRQHSRNMSRNLDARLEARREVKKRFVDRNFSNKLQNSEILGIITARGEYRFEESDKESEKISLALRKINEKPLISYVIREARSSNRLNRLILSTENEEIAEISKKFGIEVPFLRPKSLSETTVHLFMVILDLLKKLKEKENYNPDFVVLIQYISPFIKSSHIDEIVDTWLLFPVDSVISVTQNNTLLWKPSKYGLKPLFEEKTLRHEREILYKENGALYGIVPRIIFEKKKLVGEKVGHIIMEQKNSIHINSKFDFEICKKFLI